MNGIRLTEASNKEAVEEAVIRLEKRLVPSLTDRKINISQYSEKLAQYGKVWIHYDMGKPIPSLQDILMNETDTDSLSVDACSGRRISRKKDWHLRYYLNLKIMQLRIK